MHSSDDNIEEDVNFNSKLEEYRWEYIRLCAKLNKEELEDQKYDQMVLEESKKKKTKNGKKSCLVNKKDNPVETDILTNNKTASFFNGKFYSFTEFDKKKVSFKEESCDVKNEETGKENSLKTADEDNESEDIAENDSQEQNDELFNPLIESTHPNVKRKQILLNEIENFFEEIFVDEMNTVEIQNLLEKIHDLVKTFKMAAENVMFGKKYNYLLSIILFRILIVFNIVDQKYENSIKSNIFINNILTKFNLTERILDKNIFELFSYKPID